MNMMNIGGVHNNGEPMLQIGLSKNDGFVIRYNPDLQTVLFEDATTGETLPVLAPAATPFKFCGQFINFTTLLNAVTAGTIVPSNGDVYSIKNSGGLDGNDTTVSAMDMVAYGNGKWFIIGNGNDTASAPEDTSTSTEV